MPDTRQHRGPHPEDADLFDARHHATLRAATADLSWLLTRGYGEAGALKLVGDRFNLAARQRAAIRRGACTDAQLAHRRGTRLYVPRKRPVWIDGYNVLTTVEVALGGGVVLAARDGCWRDIAGVHGTYRRVEETLPAIDLLAQTLARLGPSEVVWVLDAPVSNSGRLRAILLDRAAALGVAWKVEVVPDADAFLTSAPAHAIIATADGIVLDRVPNWFSLASEVCQGIEGARVVHLSDA